MHISLGQEGGERERQGKGEWGREGKLGDSALVVGG